MLIEIYCRGGKEENCDVDPVRGVTDHSIVGVKENGERVQIFENGTWASIETLQKSLKLFWLGCGSDDFLIQASRDLDASLTKRGLKHTFYNPGGGHTWMNCRDYIELFAKEIFK